MQSSDTKMLIFTNIKLKQQTTWDNNSSAELTARSWFTELVSKTIIRLEEKLELRSSEQTKLIYSGQNSSPRQPTFPLT